METKIVFKMQKKVFNWLKLIFYSRGTEQDCCVPVWFSFSVSLCARGEIEEEEKKKKEELE